MGFGAVEFATVEGELAPSNLSSSGRRHLVRFVDGLGLQPTSFLVDGPDARGSRNQNGRQPDWRLDWGFHESKIARSV